jgi:hypothetical protein
VLAVSLLTVQPSTYTPRRKQPGTEDAISQTDQPASTPRLISSSSNSGVVGFDQRARVGSGLKQPGHDFRFVPSQLRRGLFKTDVHVEALVDHVPLDPARARTVSQIFTWRTASTLGMPTTGHLL